MRFVKVGIAARFGHGCPEKIKNDKYATLIESRESGTGQTVIISMLQQALLIAWLILIDTENEK